MARLPIFLVELIEARYQLANVQNDLNIRVTKIIFFNLTRLTIFTDCLSKYVIYYTYH